MYGGGYNNFDGGIGEHLTDNFSQQNLPGGLNSPMGERLDNLLGGNSNSTPGQIYGGASGVGGFNNMGGGGYDQRRRSH